METPCIFLPDVRVYSTGYTGRHRAVWEALYGQIPPFRDIDHQCHNEDLSCPGAENCKHRSCFNPSHYVLVSRRENIKKARTREQLRADSRRPEQTKARFALEDKSVRYCACGAGPFVGPRGLQIHKSKHNRDAMTDTPNAVWCSCGAGPFKNVHGMNIHHASKRCNPQEQK